MLTIFVAACGALSPTVHSSARAGSTISRVRHARVQVGEDYASQQEEINALRSQLRAAEATIARLSGPEAARDDFKDSRFPLFRRVQTALSRSPSDGHLAYLANEQAGPPPTDGAPDWSEQLFRKYDVDASGLLDLDEFKIFVQENLSVERLGTMAQDTAKSAGDVAADVAKSAGDLAADVLGRVNDLMPPAAAAVPVTLVGGVGSGYKEMQPASAKEVPVDGLCAAVERQASLSMHLGAFMQLIVKLDDANMRTVRVHFTASTRTSAPLPAASHLLFCRRRRRSPESLTRICGRRARGSQTAEEQSRTPTRVAIRPRHPTQVRDSWERHGRPAPLLDAGTSAGARTRVFRRALERTRTRDKRALGARSLGVRAMR
mmetsp:Transcript_19888/g.59283  ORF Transcript_19888/g.59283 Transcript_19888/m.59283 type:complete len:376 (+) Transcript_19888:495-1622(+)